MSSKSADLRIELSYLKDNVVEASAQGRTAIVENGLDVYEELVGTFVDVLSQFGSPYSREQAMSEIHSIGGGWSEIEWIRDDYREIADAALASRNFGVILPVISFPARLCIRAYAGSDYYVFAQFLDWTSYLYDRAVDDLAPTESTQFEPDAHDWLFYAVRDRLADYLQQLAFRIGVDMTDSLDPDAIENGGDFARATFVAFSRLLKRSYEQKRVGDFRHFASELQGLYRHELDRYSHFGGVPAPPPGDDDVDAMPLLSYDAVRQRTFNDLDRFREVIFLGLDAWMLRDYDQDKRSQQDIRSFRDGMYLPSSIADLWRLYLEARDRRYENELEWAWWEMREHRSREAYFGINFDLLLLTPTVLRMLVSASSVGPAILITWLVMAPAR
jgi:hypothetical protein